MTDQSSQSENSQNDQRAMCFVLLPTISSFADKLVEQIRLDFGVVAEVTSNDRSEAVSFETENGKALLTHGKFAIPKNEAGHAASGNVFWNDGTNEANQHKSHVVVVASSPGDSIEAASFLTTVVRSVLNATDAIGVYWGKGKIANSKEFFLKASADVKRSKLPLHLWVRFQLMRNDDGLHAFTVGLKQFRHQEIHTTRCDWEPKKLAGRIYDAAHYIVSGSVILKEGDTMGATDEDRFEVRFVPHPHRPEETVTQIQLS